VSVGVAIVGCGLVGSKRAQALSGGRLVVCADVDAGRAAKLAGQHPGAVATADWRAAVRHPEVAIVVVATTNNALAEVTLAAIACGKHVLVEKPAARSAEELRSVMEECRDKSTKVRVGFNHRYHPAVRRALQMARAGELGELMFIRGRYGHGGRLGYDREWRADRRQAGGGELLDQGVHLIDLARCFLGEFEHVSGFAHTFFWDMEVEDNGFMLLRTGDMKTAFLHASCTEWKNLFSLEVYGREGKLHVEGLGGSYGIERLAHYHMRPEMGPPDTVIWEFPGPDGSWAEEFKAFVQDIEAGQEPAPGLNDALEALKVVDAVYQASRR